MGLLDDVFSNINGNIDTTGIIESTCSNTSISNSTRNTYMEVDDYEDYDEDEANHIEGDSDDKIDNSDMSFFRSQYLYKVE